MESILDRVENRGINKGIDQGIKIGEARGVKRGEKRGVKRGELRGKVGVYHDEMGMSAAAIAKKTGKKLQQIEAVIRSLEEEKKKEERAK